MKKIKYSIIFINLLLIFVMSIGFSALQTDITIASMSASVDEILYMRVTGIALNSANSNSSTSSNIGFSPSAIYMDLDLPNSDSYATFNVDITNYGNSIMGLSDILNIPDNLIVETVDYNMPEPICSSTNSSNCTLGVSNTIKVRIKYKDNMYNADNTSFSLNLNLEFSKVYNVSYTNYLNNNHPVYAAANKDFIIDFGDEDVLVASVKVGGNTLDPSGYDFENKQLVVYDINGDVVIDFVVPDGALPTTPVVTDNGVEISNGYKSEFIESGSTLQYTNRFSALSEEYDNSTRTYHLTVQKTYASFQSLNSNYEDFNLTFKIKNDSDVIWTDGTTTYTYSSDENCLSNISGSIDKTTLAPGETATLQMNFKLKIYGPIPIFNRYYADNITYVISYMVNGEKRDFTVIIDFVSTNINEE